MPSSHLLLNLPRLRLCADFCFSPRTVSKDPWNMVPVFIFAYFNLPAIEKGGVLVILTYILEYSDNWYLYQGFRTPGTQ